MLQAFLAWSTSHVLSMGSCGDDQRQPRRCDQFCSSGCTSPVLWHSVCADSCPRFPSPAHPAVPLPLLAHSQASRGSSRTHLIVVLQGLVRATDPKVRRGHAPSHSMRADSRALDPSPAHPAVLLPLPTRRQPSPRVVENAPQPASTAPAGADRAPQCILEPRAPSSSRPSPTTGTFHAAGCVSFRPGAFDAVGDSNPVPERVTCPRPHRNVPTRAGCPQPRRLSAGHPWHPEPLVRQLHQHRPPTTTSGPHTRARSDQAGEGAASSRGGEAPSHGVRAPGPVDLTLAELTRPAAQCPQR